MFDNIMSFFRKMRKKEVKNANSKEQAKERLHLVLMQDRANVSADFLDLMKQEIIEVIKKYIEVDEEAIDVRLTNKDNGDGTTGAPALYANIPIMKIKEDLNKVKHEEKKEIKEENENQNNESSENIIENKQKELEEVITEKEENMEEEAKKEETSENN